MALDNRFMWQPTDVQIGPPSDDGLTAADLENEDGSEFEDDELDTLTAVDLENEDGSEFEDDEDE